MYTSLKAYIVSVCKCEVIPLIARMAGIRLKLELNSIENALLQDPDRDHSLVANSLSVYKILVL